MTRKGALTPYAATDPTKRPEKHMHDVSLLVNIAIALVVAFAGGLIARRIGLPTIVGYMLAGIIIGPFTPGFVGDASTINQLAELGVIFLMFGVGLHFSFADLWKVRDIAIPGALGQMLIATLLGYGLTQLWGWSSTASLVFGLAISIASTVVLLRGLMDNSLLNTPHGQAAVGWLIFEDLATVLILLLMPALTQTQGGLDWPSLGETLLKAAAFIAIVVLVGENHSMAAACHCANPFARAVHPGHPGDCPGHLRSPRPSFSGYRWRSAPSWRAWSSASLR